MIETLPPADKIVFFTLAQMPQGQPIRVRDLAYRCNYVEVTVYRSLRRLAESRLIRRHRPCLGLPYSYEVYDVVSHS